jgi:uncharacterized protein
VKRIAVIGAGISGLAAAYFLSRRHRVTVFEREPRLGGHTHTVRVDTPSGVVALDTGFLVHNRATYPNLVRLFAELNVDTQPSDMSFSVSCGATGLEYSSRGAAGFFAQPRNLFSPAHYRMLRDIVRFNRLAPRVLDLPAAAAGTLATHVREHGYGREFVSRYLVPMTSAIWSAPASSIDRFPIQTLVRFMQNHGMLAVTTQVPWRVVRGGSDAYLAPLSRPVKDRIVLGSRLTAVDRHAAGVTLRFADREPAPFDEVVFACHGDQVLPLLSAPTPREQAIFGAFKTTTNDVVLHTDDSVLPRAQAAQASWNYRLDSNADAPPALTYDLNRLQSIPGPTRYCVTLNPRQPIAEAAVIRRLQYRHPQYSPETVAAQSVWHEVSGHHRTHYCGAYWRYGFHEDGMVSALRVAEGLGVTW